MEDLQAAGGQEAQQESRSEDQAESPKPSRLAGLQGLVGRTAHSAAGKMRRLGLILFMVLLPLLVVSYPAYLIGGKLWEYQSAKPVEVKLERIEINTVENDQDRSTWLESRKHIDIVFYFEGPNGQKLASFSDHAWPAPGLKRRLESQYQPGDEFTLYQMPDQSNMLDVDLAVSNFSRMTALMGLVLLATLVSALMWKRLLHQMPDSLPDFPQAIAYSVLTAQGVALLVAALFAWINTLSTMMIPNQWYLSAYWGLVAILTLTMRLLVFTPPPAPAKPQAEDEEQGRLGRSRAVS